MCLFQWPAWMSFPGDIIHMDENGACKFPADRLADVCKNVDAFIKIEEEREVKAYEGGQNDCRNKSSFLRQKEEIAGNDRIERPAKKYKNKEEKDETK